MSADTGRCLFCEDPLPEGASGYCDDTCRDLDARILKPKRKATHLGNGRLRAHPNSRKDVEEQKRRFEQRPEEGPP